MFIIVVNCSIMGYMLRDNLKETLHNGLNETIHQYNKGGFIARDFDKIQELVTIKSDS